MAEAARIVSIAALQYRVPVVAAAFTLLVVGPAVNSAAFAQQAPQYTQQTQQPQQSQQQQFNVQQINQLVAPIALYPDNLLGQILAASTYPLEIVVAARWSSSNQNVSGQPLEDAMQLQSWDPSVKALTAVPQVLQMMSEKLEWTQQLGAAYLAQPDDIAAAVQRLRARADASGNLNETKQIKVRREPAPPPPPAYVGDPLPPEYIVIEPYEPDYLYVPIYDPYVVYGPWPYPAWRPFYWYPPGYVAVGIIGFGAPCIVGAAIWANYSWRSRSVIVDVHKFDKFHHTKLASLGGGGTQAWKYKSATFSGPKVGSGSPKTFTSAGKPPGNAGFNAGGPGGNNGLKPDHKRQTTFNPSNGGSGGKPQGLVSNNQSGQGNNRVRTYSNNNGPKPSVQKLTNNQTFRSAPNFRAATSVKPAPRGQYKKP
jgi:Protein of unknown function (DUF3300)